MGIFLPLLHEILSTKCSYSQLMDKMTNQALLMEYKIVIS
jgi:hypothetical protein